MAKRCNHKQAVEKLLKIRTDQPEVNYSDALVELDLPQKNLTVLEDLLTDSSTCFSLWVVAGDGHNAYYEVSVLDDLSDSDGFTTFVW